MSVQGSVVLIFTTIYECIKEMWVDIFFMVATVKAILKIFKAVNIFHNLKLMRNVL